LPATWCRRCWPTTATCLSTSTCVVLPVLILATTKGRRSKAHASSVKPTPPLLCFSTAHLPALSHTVALLKLTTSSAASSSAPVHRSSSPSHALTSCPATKSRSRCRVPCHPKHLPSTGLCRPFLDPLDPTLSFTQPRGSSPTTPTPPATTTPACRPSSPITSSLCRGQAPLVSPLPSAALNPFCRHASLLPEPSPLPLAAGNRWIPAGHRRLDSGRKCRVGRATSLAGWAVSLLAGAVHCNSGVSLLYFELIQNSVQI
jgi:cell division septation protein DedD